MDFEENIKRRRISKKVKERYNIPVNS